MNVGSGLVGPVYSEPGSEGAIDRDGQRCLNSATTIFKERKTINGGRAEVRTAYS